MVILYPCLRYKSNCPSLVLDEISNSSKFIKKQQNLLAKSEILLEKSIRNLSGGGN